MSNYIELSNCSLCGKEFDSDSRDLGTYFCNCQKRNSVDTSIIQQIANQLQRKVNESRPKTANAIHVNAD